MKVKNISVLAGVLISVFICFFVYAEDTKNCDQDVINAGVDIYERYAERDWKRLLSSEYEALEQAKEAYNQARDALPERTPYENAIEAWENRSPLKKYQEMREALNAHYQAEKALRAAREDTRTRRTARRRVDRAQDKLDRVREAYTRVWKAAHEEVDQTRIIWNQTSRALPEREDYKNAIETLNQAGKVFPAWEAWNNFKASLTLSCVGKIKAAYNSRQERLRQNSSFSSSTDTNSNDHNEKSSGKNFEGVQ